VVRGKGCDAGLLSRARVACRHCQYAGIPFHFWKAYTACSVVSDVVHAGHSGNPEPEIDQAFCCTDMTAGAVRTGPIGGRRDDHRPRKDGRRLAGPAGTCGDMD